MTIRQWMRAEKLNQVQAARVLGVDQSSLSNWLNRRRLIDRVKALDIERRTKGKVTVDSWPTTRAETPRVGKKRSASA